MWTIAAANKKLNGPLGSYNGLTDVHLAHYFSTPSRQSHLKAAKLIKSDGTIVPDEKVKMTSLQYEKKKKMYDILASTVIQNAAHKESSWNKKLCSFLEDISKMENVEKMKGGSRKNFTVCHNNHILREFSTIPHLQSIDKDEWHRTNNCERGFSTFPRSGHSACKCCLNDSTPLHTNVAKLKRCFSAIETSPYAPLCGSHACRSHSGLPQIIGLRKKKKKRRKNAVNEQIKSSTSNTINKVNNLLIPDQSFKLDQCKVSLYYHGHTPLTKSSVYIKEEVLIRQQHCGGTSVVVYKGEVAPNEIVTFTTLTHVEYSFSIILFLDGIRYLKLSSCCVFRYSSGKRLGGTSGSFSIQSIQGGKPCAKCQYRQIEICSKDMQQKLMCSEHPLPIKEVKALPASPYQEEQNSPAAEYPSYDVTNCQEINIETEESDSSVVSEIINSQSEELGGKLTNVFDNDAVIDNGVIDDEEILEDTNVISINEDINDPTESSYDSETSSIAESVKNFVRPEIKAYASESSDDEDGGKQHVVLASVHGSPNGST